MGLQCVGVCVYVGFVMSCCFGNCVVILVICVLVFTVFCYVKVRFLLFRLYIYIFILIWFFCTNLRTAATE